jgi:hypothetical protein
MLTHNISGYPQATMEVNIHNQCLDFKLTDRECFSGGADWNKWPDAEVMADNTMKADLIPFRAVFGGILIYELLRKDVDPSIRLESTFTLLLVAWKSEGYKKLYVLMRLIECNLWPRWFKFKPEEYYQRYVSQLSTYTDPIKDTWLLPDGAIVMTRLELDFTQRDGVLNITISESVNDDYTRTTEWINLNR